MNTFYQCRIKNLIKTVSLAEANANPLINN